VRLSLPDGPGIYRMLRTSGDVLYVGKAASLRHRVNSYFRKQHGIPERTLEMLSQARRISFEEAPSALEAALLESDEIKQRRPPYNIALTVEHRTLWFAAPDLSSRAAQPSTHCPLGPFPSAGMLDDFNAFTAADPHSLGSGRWCPDAAVFEAGFASLCASHSELSRHEISTHDRLLRLGTRLWREGRRDHDVDEDAEGRRITNWTPELVQRSLEWLALRAALARRRAIWLTRLVDSSVVWTEPGATAARLIVLECGEIVQRTDAAADATPPVPPAYGRSIADRRDAFTVARFDRLRVLTTELKRLVAAGAPVALRLGPGPPLTDAGLSAVVWWVGCDASRSWLSPRGSDLQRATKCPGRVVRLGAVMVGEHVSVAAIAEDRASKLPDVGGRLHPARGLQIELAQHLQLSILLFRQQLDTHGGGHSEGAVFRFVLLPRCERLGVVAHAAAAFR
jgi:hypothetical protein